MNLAAMQSFVLCLCCASASAAVQQPSSIKQLHHTRRTAVTVTLPLLGLSPAAASDYTPPPLEFFDYLSPTRFAVKKQRQKQQNCYDAGECVDAQPYFAMECDRNDIECLQRKRRMANQELQDFLVDPTSSPLFLLAAGAVVFQWGSAAVRIGFGLLSRATGEAPDDDQDDV